MTWQAAKQDMAFDKEQKGKAMSKHKPIRDMTARKILHFIEDEYKTLPFSSRWLVKKFGQRVLFSLRMLEQAGALHHYAQLVEKSKQPVSQAEHTILVNKDKAVVLTSED